MALIRRFDAWRLLRISRISYPVFFIRYQKVSILSCFRCISKNIYMFKRYNMTKFWYNNNKLYFITMDILQLVKNINYGKTGQLLQIWSSRRASKRLSEAIRRLCGFPFTCENKFRRYTSKSLHIYVTYKVFRLPQNINDE